MRLTFSLNGSITEWVVCIDVPLCSRGSRHAAVLLLPLTAAVSVQLNVVTALLSPQQPPQQCFLLLWTLRVCVQLNIGSLLMWCAVLCQTWCGLCSAELSVAFKWMKRHSPHYFTFYQTIKFMNTPLHPPVSLFLHGRTLLSVFPRMWLSPRVPPTDDLITLKGSAPPHLFLLSLSNLSHYWNYQLP